MSWKTRLHGLHTDRWEICSLNHLEQQNQSRLKNLSKTLLNQLQNFGNILIYTRLDSSDFNSSGRQMTPQDCANSFFNFFSSILNKFTFTPTDICKRFIRKTFSDSVFLSSILKSSKKFCFRSVTKLEVFKLLKKIDKLSAPGPKIQDEWKVGVVHQYIKVVV